MSGKLTSQGATSEDAGNEDIVKEDTGSEDTGSGEVLGAENEQLWGIEEFLTATRGRPVGQMPDGVSGISIDTRTLQTGDAFFGHQRRPV